MNVFRLTRLLNKDPLNVVGHINDYLVIGVDGCPLDHLLINVINL